MTLIDRLETELRIHREENFALREKLSREQEVTKKLRGERSELAEKLAELADELDRIGLSLVRPERAERTGQND